MRFYFLALLFLSLPLIYNACGPSPQGAISSSQEESQGSDSLPIPNACNDGIDNDGDGLVDWGMDLGCTALNDSSEGGLDTQLERHRFYAYEAGSGSTITYVDSQNGNDQHACGAGVNAPKRTVASAVSCFRSGQEDWVLLRAGQTWNERVTVNFSGGGRSAPHILSSYYPSVIDGSLNRPQLMGGIQISAGIRHFVLRDLETIFSMHNINSNGCNNNNCQHIIIEGNDMRYAEEGLLLSGSDLELRHNNFIGFRGTGLFTGNNRAEQGAPPIVLWDTFAYHWGAGQSSGGAHFLYGSAFTTGGFESARYDTRYNLGYGGADFAGIARSSVRSDQVAPESQAYSPGNFLMMRPGAISYRNAGDSIWWQTISMGAPNDGAGGTHSSFSDAVIDDTYCESNGSQCSTLWTFVGMGPVASGRLTDSCVYSPVGINPTRANSAGASLFTTEQVINRRGLLDYYAARGGTVTGDLAVDKAAFYRDWLACKRTANLGGNTPRLGDFCDLDKFFDWLYANTSCSNQHIFN